MTNNIQKIESLQKQNQSNKDELIRLEEKDKHNKEEKNGFLNTLKELKIDEDELSDKLGTRDEELTDKLNKIEEDLK